MHKCVYIYPKKSKLFDLSGKIKNKFHGWSAGISRSYGFLFKITLPCSLCIHQIATHYVHLFGIITIKSHFD
jgi:hypothetical protein